MTTRVERDTIDGPDGFPIRLRVHHTAGAAGSVVLCHGFKGFMDWGFFPWLAERLASSRLNVVSFDLSGSGITPDGRFADQEAFASNTFSRELRDLHVVLAESIRRGWIGDAFGLMGHSRGGGIAVLQTARDPRVRALVTWAAISTVRRWSDAELRAWRGRGFLEVRNARTGEVLRQNTEMVDDLERHADGALDIGRAAGSIRVPWLVIHGTEDETVSADEAHRLHAAAAPGTARLELLETGHTMGAAHPLRERPAVLERAVALTVDFFVAHLR